MRCVHNPIIILPPQPVASSSTYVCKVRQEVTEKQFHSNSERDVVIINCHTDLKVICFQNKAVYKKINVTACMLLWVGIYFDYVTLYHPSTELVVIQ